MKENRVGNFKTFALSEILPKIYISERLNLIAELQKNHFYPKYNWTHGPST